MSFNLPKTSATGGESASSGERWEVIDSSSNRYKESDLIDKLSERTREIDSDLLQAKKEIASLETTIKNETQKQSLKNIEIIGIFSAILSFIIIDVNIIKSAESFYSAIFLMFGMALILCVFVILIHKLFSPDKVQLREYFFSKVIIILGIFLFFTWLLGTLYPESAFKESYQKNIDKKFAEQEEALRKINEDTINQINDIKKCITYSTQVNINCFK